MLKIIDLDHIGKEKDRDALIFTLTVGGEKIGVSEDELADLIRAKAGGQKAGKKGVRKVQGASDASETDTAELDGQEKGSWNKPIEGDSGAALA